MYNALNKYGQLGAFSLGIIVIALFLGSAFSGLAEFNQMSFDQQKTSGIFDIGLALGLALIVITAVIALVAGLFHVASNPKESLKGIIGLVAIIAIFFIAYSMFSGDPASMGEKLQEFRVSEPQSQIITGSISTAIALIAIATVTFIVSELLNLFR